MKRIRSSTCVSAASLLATILAGQGCAPGAGSPGDEAALPSETSPDPVAKPTGADPSAEGIPAVPERVPVPGPRVRGMSLGAAGLAEPAPGLWSPSSPQGGISPPSPRGERLPASRGSCQYNVVSGGGRVLAAPTVHRVFWGSWWTQAANTGRAAYFDTTWSALATYPAITNRLSEYGVGTGSAGRRWDLPTEPTGALSDAAIQFGLLSAIAASGYQPTANDVFVVFMPSGTWSASDQTSGALGHHQHFTAPANVHFAYDDIVYAVIDPTDNYSDGGLDEANGATSHELMEAETDPDVNDGFRDYSMYEGEIGDLCEGHYPYIGGYHIQSSWSQVACRCVGERDLNGVDYDGDGTLYPSVFRPSPGLWYGYDAPSHGGYSFGIPGDVPVPGDFNGDGRTEATLFRPSTGQWFIMDPTTATYTVQTLGQSGDIPVPGDYDGDGITDRAVYRQSSGTWYVVSSKTGLTTATAIGGPGDVPVPADYDGDGKTDIAVRRPSNTTWYVLVSSLPGTTNMFSWGVPTDVPVTGDFDGDGFADAALWRASEGRFYVSTAGGAYSVQWGAAGDVPVTRDYDADWQTDLAVFRPSNGTWYVINSATNTTTSIAYGASPGDIPVMRMPQ